MRLEDLRASLVSIFDSMLFGVRASKNTYLGKKLLLIRRVKRHLVFCRVVHAPMTRLRSDPDDSLSEMMVEYYRQRTSEGLLMITESSHMMKSGRGSGQRQGRGQPKF